MTTDDREDRELELQDLARQLADARSRYDTLRNRKSVRAALAIGDGGRHALEATRERWARLVGRHSPPKGNTSVGYPPLRWPIDHYYSPVPDNRVLATEPTRSRVWPARPRPTVGIDWRDEEQVVLVRDGLGTQDHIHFPDGPTGDPRDYYRLNEMFSLLDAWFLQGMLRHFRPKRMIEVGCGFSSLVTARINREYLDHGLKFTCVEPYPPDYLATGVDGVSELIASTAQDVPLETYLELDAGEFLFIDSSHTVKTGSDVVFFLTEVLPNLRPGVIVHLHDIFLPWDYPQEWVFEGRAWNEQYAVHAFLEFNSAFRVLVGSAWMIYHHPNLLATVVPEYPSKHENGGGSLWIQRI